MDWTLGFVGSGVMAEVMIAGLLDERILPTERIIASDRNADRARALADRFGIRDTTDNVQAATESDVLVLSVKPQTLGGVLTQLRGKIPPNTLVISIVAGATMGTIRRILEHDKVVRCMPNLPCRIRQGMTVWTAPKDAAAADLARVEAVLGVMGIALRVDDESHVDRATAVNGTGPAIVAQFVKAMLEAATFIGEPRAVAQDTVVATLAGTIEMIRRAHEDGTHVAQLIDEVTSPGGTTSRALQVLKQGRFSAVVTDAIAAAHDRTVALGKALEDNLE